MFVSCWVPCPLRKPSEKLVNQSSLIRFIIENINTILKILVVSQMGSQGRILIGFRSWAEWMLGSFASQRTCWVWQNLWYNSFGLLNTGRWRRWSKCCWTNGLVLISKLFWLVTVFTFRNQYYLEQVARSFLLVLSMTNIKKVQQVPILFNTGTGKHVGFSYQYCILLIN